MAKKKQQLMNPSSSEMVAEPESVDLKPVANEYPLSAVEAKSAGQLSQVPGVETLWFPRPLAQPYDMSAIHEAATERRKQGWRLVAVLPEDRDEERESNGAADKMLGLTKRRFHVQGWLTWWER
jgi:hypothetical protein